jgi:hypothetical protein
MYAGPIACSFYEPCTLTILRDRLRGGDVCVAGSGQYRAHDAVDAIRQTWPGVRMPRSQGCSTPSAHSRWTGVHF